MSEDERRGLATGILTGVAILTMALASLRQLHDLLTQNFGEPAPPGRKKPMWGKHIPALARAAADMLDIAPQLFPWVAFSGAALRQREEEVRLLSLIVSAVGGLHEYLRKLLKARKDELYRMTTGLVADVKAVQESPATPPELKNGLRDISPMVTSIVKERSQAIKKKHREHKALVQEAQAQVDAAQAILDQHRR